MRLHRIAEQCLAKLGSDGPTRLVLSLFFKAVLGIQRIFHFETLDDPGLAILTGGRKVLSRNRLGGLLRAAPVRGVLKLVHRTEPQVKQADRIGVSIDEHAIARFTRKFDIRKGFHTIRNKKMKIEKLFFAFHLGTGKLLSLIVTRGNAQLAALSEKLLARLRRRAGGAQLRVVLDAGAAHNHEKLLELVAHGKQATLVRTPRREAYRKAWAALPASAWSRREEAGPYTKAPPKVIHVTETRTALSVRKSGAPQRTVSVRTIVVREEKRGGKERWHAIWVFNDEQTPAFDLVEEYRTRQHHEQAYRVMLHDAFVDTAASGYNKNSRNLRRPGFLQNSLTLYAWIAALAVNTLDTLTRALPTPFLRAHPRTIRRWLLHVPAELFLGNGTLIVLLAPRRLRSVWEHLVPQANRSQVRIPWLENRRLVLSLTPRRRGNPEAAIDPRRGIPGVWC